MTQKSATTVLRSIVSPAIGLSVGVLVAAGAVSGCGDSTSPTADSSKPSTSSPKPVGTTVNTIEAPGKRSVPEPSVTTGDSAPPASASVAPSAVASTTATAIPKPGDIPPPGQRPVPPGTMPLPRPGPPARVGMVGYNFAPGFGASTTDSEAARTPLRSAPEERPTRMSRRVSDATRSSWLGRAAARGLV